MLAPFLTLFILAAGAFAAAAPLLPSEDPFYDEPANISSYSPGAVIRSRQVANGLNGLIDDGISTNVNATYQYFYRTTDSNGTAVGSVTTLLVPNNADPSKLLAYQQAYDSANNNCSPSYALRAGANTTAIADIIFIIASLNNGWYVVTSDYEGLDAKFTNGVTSGYATLDSVRAAFNEASSSGLSPSARHVLWGYSGGSLASEWAAELQPSYAPELTFAGAALGGLIPNVSEVLVTINGGLFAGLAFSGIYGLYKSNTSFAALFDEEILAAKKAEFYEAATGCLEQAIEDGVLQDLYSYFKDGEETVREPAALWVLENLGQMGTHGVPTMPVFAYKAIADEISPVLDTTELVTKLCSEGALIELHLDTVGEHFTESITGSASALSWVSDRLSGIPVTNTECVTEYVALTSVSLGTVDELSEDLVAALESLLGGDLGPAISG